MEQVVVDVVAAARKLLNQAVPTPGELNTANRSQSHEAAQSADVPTCQFAHPNPFSARFCGECGLPTGVEVLDMEAAMTPPKTEVELTPEEKVFRETQHQQALAANAAFANAPAPEIEPAAGPNITVHFVDDGLSALGHVWLRGQQLTIGPDHPRWPDARRWVTMTTDEQIQRYGKPYFAPGPVPRLESAAEQQHQVEVRRMMGRRAVSGVPEELAGLLDVT